MLRSALTLSILISLAGCAHNPESQLATPAPAMHLGTLKLADWNMEFLAERDGVGCHPRSRRDYAAIKSVVDRINADVFAFEEVENEAAAARVFDPRRYAIVMEHRRGTPSGTCGRDNSSQPFIRQAVGFAIKKSLAFTRGDDVTALQLGNPNLRSGVQVLLRPVGGEPLRLLVVHLKSGCFQGENGRGCSEILQQMPVIRAWVQSAAEGGARFAVLGDWNRRLARPDDVFWKTIDAADGSDADLTLADDGIAPRCDPKYHEFIDHIVLDRRAAQQVSGFAETTFPPHTNQSDHCPISIILPR